MQDRPHLIGAPNLLAKHPFAEAVYVSGWVWSSSASAWHI
jgi:hypothetical protein